jgi:hypothetical protein
MSRFTVESGRQFMSGRKENDRREALHRYSGIVRKGHGAGGGGSGGKVDVKPSRILPVSQPTKGRHSGCACSRGTE